MQLLHLSSTIRPEHLIKLIDILVIPSHVCQGKLVFKRIIVFRNLIAAE